MILNDHQAHMLLGILEGTISGAEIFRETLIIQDSKLPMSWAERKKLRNEIVNQQSAKFVDLQ